MVVRMAAVISIAVPRIEIRILREWAQRLGQRCIIAEILCEVGIRHGKSERGELRGLRRVVEVQSEGPFAVLLENGKG